MQGFGGCQGKRRREIAVLEIPRNLDRRLGKFCLRQLTGCCGCAVRIINELAKRLFCRFIHVVLDHQSFPLLLICFFRFGFWNGFAFPHTAVQTVTATLIEWFSHTPPEKQSA